MRSIAREPQRSLPGSPALWVFPLAVLVAVFLGVAVSVIGFLAVVAVVGVGGLVFLIATAHRPAVFLGALGFLMIGYAFFGRSFAHLGLSPLYVGEMVMSLAGVAFMVRLRKARLGLLEVLLFGLMFWGIVRTVPYISVHGIDALRDSSIWLYAIFALAVSTVIQREHVDFIVRQYGRLLPWFLVWVPVAIGILMTIGSSLPTTPGSDVPIIWPKAGDMGVHLGGIAAFILIGLYARTRVLTPERELMLWPLWLIGVVLVAAINRGGLLAVTIAVAVTFMLRPTKRILTPIIAGLAIGASILLINPTIEIGAREVSANQLASNVLSIFSAEDKGQLEGTREWRLSWWTDIVNYTVNGEYRWTGKGFGINLADDDGYQANADGSIRSPHNGHMTILARMGVPGIAIWFLLHAGFAISMVRAIFRARGRQNTFWMQVNAWILAYWLAMMVNASFDVYLEGPQGGIWFWVVFGLGLAVLRLQRAEFANEDESARQAESRGVSPWPATYNRS